MCGQKTVIAMCSESLLANHDLLDSHFDGYKLSLDPLATYSVDLASGVDAVKLGADQYTLQHVKAFGIPNHLISDPWNPNCVFYVDQQRSVIQHRVTLDSELLPGRVVFKIRHACEQQTLQRHNVSMYFPSCELCTLADGAGKLYVLATCNRDIATVLDWQVLYSEDVCSPARPCIILHSVVQAHQSSVDCLLLRIEEDASSVLGTFIALLDWLTVTQLPGASSYQLSRRRQLKSKCAPFYASVEPTGQALYLASESEFSIIEDSSKTTESLGQESVDKKDTAAHTGASAPSYTWTQSCEDVSLVFVLPPSVPKSDVYVTLTMNTIHIHLGANGKDLLKGALYRAIDVHMSTWILQDGKLEVMLTKADQGPMWTEVAIGSQRGEYIVDEDQARIIHERLAHLTSDQLNPDPVPGGSRPGIGPHDLEECDELPDGYSSLVRLDGETHIVTNRASLSSHQFLFNAQLHPGKPICICLRHDVDGLIWQPYMKTPEHKTPWNHAATFNALGYVQASKRDRKYSCCSPSCSYAVICDCISHLYVYHQPTDIPSPLRNRKSGRVVSHIAKQQLVSLESADEIIGIVASNERVFVLTNNKLYVISVA